MKRTEERSNTTDPAAFEVGRRFTSYQPGVTPQSSVAIDAPIVEPVPIEKKKFPWKRTLLVVLLILIIPIIIIGFMDYKNASSASKQMFGTSNLFSALPPNSLTNTNDRTNILLIGYSADDPGHGGATLTDSIMVVSLDKASKTGYTLSIPRDLYVKIPDYGSAKINEAYQAGERQSFKEAGYPNGGAGLLEKVIYDNFNISVQYYVVINYGAVREITEALGGITVTIESPDPRGLYDPNFKATEGGPLKLANGPQTLDGQTALRLTRARGSTAGSYGFPQSDFNRTQNQQKVFAAIKSKITAQQLLDPRINKGLFDAMAANLQTDLTINQVLPLYQLFKKVPDSGLTPVNLRDFNGKNLLASYATPSGQSALIPAAGISNYTAIQSALASLDR